MILVYMYMHTFIHTNASVILLVYKPQYPMCVASIDLCVHACASKCAPPVRFLK